MDGMKSVVVRLLCGLLLVTGFSCGSNTATEAPQISKQAKYIVKFKEPSSFLRVRPKSPADQLAALRENVSHDKLVDQIRDSLFRLDLSQDHASPVDHKFRKRQ